MSKNDVLERPVPRGPGQTLINHQTLPVDDFEQFWNKIHLAPGLKDRLLGQAIVSLTLREKLGQVNCALHGIIVLIGPPGTGKTTIARGLANAIAKASGKKIDYAELDPHQLNSSLHGQTQKAVVRLLEEGIPSVASNGNPAIILLDEVETFAVARDKISMETNPIDVHRATDAILSGVDRLAAKYPNLLFVATSNFKNAVDRAFLSRADAVIHIDNPEKGALKKIFADVVADFSKEWPELKKLSNEKFIDSLAETALGIDGRQARKLFPMALASSPKLALHPKDLTEEVLLSMAREVKSKGDE